MQFVVIFAVVMGVVVDVVGLFGVVECYLFVQRKWINGSVMWVYLQKRLLEDKESTVSKRPKFSSNIAYKHSAVLPRDTEVQKHRILVG